MPPRKFQFRLQTVLEHKQKREEEEQRELARIRDILAFEQERLFALERLYEERQREKSRKGEEGLLNVEELKRYHDHEKRLIKEIASQAIRVQQAEADVEAQRQRLLEASKEKKTYEKLKEKHYQNYLADVDAEERKLIDEIATTKFDRQGERFF